MIATIILGLGAVAAAFAVVANWKSIVKWFKDFVTALIGLFQTALKGIAHAAAAFIETAREGFANINHKLYYEEDNHYVEEIRVRQIPENELPDWAKRKLNTRREQDISNEVERELRLTL